MSGNPLNENMDRGDLDGQEVEIYLGLTSQRESYLAQRGNIPQTMTSKTGLYNEEMKINPVV